MLKILDILYCVFMLYTCLVDACVIVIDFSTGLTVDDDTKCFVISFNNHKQSASDSSSNSHSALSLDEQVPVNHTGKLIISIKWSVLSCLIRR